MFNCFNWTFDLREKIKKYLILLLLGLQDGVILAWKGNNENPNLFEPATSLKGHTGAVICLTVGKKRLYSGSTDNTIRVILALTNLPIVLCLCIEDGFDTCDFT